MYCRKPANLSIPGTPGKSKILDPEAGYYGGFPQKNRGCEPHTNMGWIDQR